MCVCVCVCVQFVYTPSCGLIATENSPKNILSVWWIDQLTGSQDADPRSAVSSSRNTDGRTRAAGGFVQNAGATLYHLVHRKHKDPMSLELTAIDRQEVRMFWETQTELWSLCEQITETWVGSDPADYVKTRQTDLVAHKRADPQVYHPTVQNRSECL